MAKRFVSIWFPHLATDWFVITQPQLRKKAFVLQGTSHGRMIITAASILAQSQGVQPGMTLADARAIFPSLHALDDKPGLNDQLLKRIAGWCIRFTPIAAPNWPDGILLDASGCSHLWGGEEIYIQDITKRLTARGYTIRMAIADTIGAAWAIARFGKEGAVIPKNVQVDALLNLPPQALRVDPETIIRLHKLGLRKIADFISMPHSVLRRHFNTLIINRLKQALGEEEELVQPIYPLKLYVERLPCLEPIVTLTGIEIALQQLLQKLCSRMRKDGKGFRSAYFSCYRVDTGVQGIEIGTSRATHNEEHLFHLFSLKLSTLQPDA
ncbi:MAG: DNA polymerase Y family protein, partial [Bacteroidota bacterium]|nr:DNA polymerase Y family protein [Bacteroidota bacterium]